MTSLELFRQAGLGGLFKRANWGWGDISKGVADVGDWVGKKMAPVADYIKPTLTGAGIGAAGMAIPSMLNNEEGESGKDKAKRVLRKALMGAGLGGVVGAGAHLLTPQRPAAISGESGKDGPKPPPTANPSADSGSPEERAYLDAKKSAKPPTPTGVQSNQEILARNKYETEKKLWEAKNTQAGIDALDRQKTVNDVVARDTAGSLTMENLASKYPGNTKGDWLGSGLGIAGSGAHDIAPGTAAIGGLWGARAGIREGNNDHNTMNETLGKVSNPDIAPSADGYTKRFMERAGLSGIRPEPKNIIAELEGKFTNNDSLSGHKIPKGGQLPDFKKWHDNTRLSFADYKAKQHDIDQWIAKQQGEHDSKVGLGQQKWDAYAAQAKKQFEVDRHLEGINALAAKYPKTTSLDKENILERYMQLNPDLARPENQHIVKVLAGSDKSFDGGARGLNISNSTGISALQIDPATGQPKLDSSGKPLPPKAKHWATALSEKLPWNKPQTDDERAAAHAQRSISRANADDPNSEAVLGGTKTRDAQLRIKRIVPKALGKGIVRALLGYALPHGAGTAINSWNYHRGSPLQREIWDKWTPSQEFMKDHPTPPTRP